MKANFLSKLDQIGFTASTLCAIHCALMPFIITILPLIGLEFLSSPWVELAIISLSVVVGISSLVPSYFRFHRNCSPILLLLLGFGLIFGTHLLAFHNLEPILVPFGGIAIAAAHFINWKLTKSHCHTCYTTPENK
jgi:hypothetical protein